MTPIRLGLIGVGFHARTVHLAALPLAPELQLIAVATSRPETAKAAGELCRTPAFVGAEELLERADVEAVLISASMREHDAATAAALQRGKHVLVESPGLTTIEGALANARLAEQRGLVVQVGFCFRYSPLFDLLREQLADVSRPRLWAFEYYWIFGHITNLALHLCGPVERVVSASQSEAGTVATLRFAGGDTAVLVGRPLSNAAMEMESVRVSTAGFYAAVEGRRRVRVFRDLVPTPVGDWSPRTAAGQVFEPQIFGGRLLEHSGYAPQLRAFARSIRTGEPVRSTLQAAVDTARLNQQIQAAASA